MILRIFFALVASAIVIMLGSSRFMCIWIVAFGVSFLSSALTLQHYIFKVASVGRKELKVIFVKEMTLTAYLLFALYVIMKVMFPFLY